MQTVGSYAVTGKVVSYEIDTSSRERTGANPEPFFVVTIDEGHEKYHRFYLPLVLRRIVDTSQSGTDYWAVSLSQLQQAAIATLKDALLHDRRVTCVGSHEGADGISNPTGGTIWNVLLRVTLHGN